MRDGIGQLWHRLRTRWLNKDNTLRILLWAGLVGMLLIGLSEWFPHREVEEEAAVVLTEGQVEQALEQRITALLREAEGVGACHVMVTLESDTQSVYAADVTSSTAADGAISYGEHYLTVDTEGGPVGLLITRILPTVKGVAVVCDGGGNAAVQQRVIQLVTTAFHISERRVCVVEAE